MPSRGESNQKTEQTLQPKAGQYVDKYEIQGELGRGGMAVVYKGFDPELRRTVAIKLTLPHLASDPVFSARFEQESRFEASLNHPNVVAVYQVGKLDNQRYIVMQYVAGGTLAKLLSREPHLSFEQTLDLLKQLAAALDHAHRAGIVHRDLKPSNILLDDGGRRVLLADFGIARAMDTMTRLTTPGAMIGTGAYMAPEQIVDEQIGPATDQYALGIVAYEMLCGCVPFVAATPTGVLAMKLRQPPPPIQQFNPALPGEVSDVLNRVLAKQPGERFPSATEFVRSLARALESATAPAVVTEVRAAAAAAPTCALTVVHGPQPGQIHSLDARPFVLGRETGADLVVDDSRVSRRHFRITSTDGAYWIEDLGSGNGTFVNGARTDKKQLTTGDVIRAGGIELEVSVATTPVPAFLTIREESAPSRVYELHGSLTCGRDASNDLILIDDQISRNHIRLVPDKGGYRVDDLQSRNGTFINGRRVQSAQLRSGDIIRLGKFALEFHQPDGSDEAPR